MLGVIGWIVFGSIVGVVAKLLVPGNDPVGFVITIVLGIVGALVGGFLGRVFGLYEPGEAAGFLMSVGGAILVLFLHRRLATARS